MKSWEYIKKWDYIYDRWYDPDVDLFKSIWLKRNHLGVWEVADESRPAPAQDKIDTVALAAII